MGCTDPTNVLSGSVASYLFCADVRLYILMTHRNDRYRILLSHFRQDCKSQTGFAAEVTRLKDHTAAEQKRCTAVTKGVGMSSSEEDVAAVLENGRTDASSRCVTRLARTEAWIDSYRSNSRTTP